MLETSRVTPTARRAREFASKIGLRSELEERVLAIFGKYAEPDAPLSAGPRTRALLFSFAMGSERPGADEWFALGQRQVLFQRRRPSMVPAQRRRPDEAGSPTMGGRARTTSDLPYPRHSHPEALRGLVVARVPSPPRGGLPCPKTLAPDTGVLKPFREAHRYLWAPRRATAYAESRRTIDVGCSTR